MMMTMTFVFVNDVPKVSKQENKCPCWIKVPEVGNVFVKKKQQKMREQAEYDSCNTDGVKGIELKHAHEVIHTI